jgi:hypothetical protein
MVDVGFARADGHGVEHVPARAEAAERLADDEFPEHAPISPAGLGGEGAPAEDRGREGARGYGAMRSEELADR